MSFKLLKVFDVKEMPLPVLEAVFREYEGHPNNFHIHFFLAEEDFIENHSEYSDDYKLIRQWILNNGMTKDDEKVLIHYRY